MKEKIYYVVNLDSSRLFFLFTLLCVLLTSFFFLGVSIGRSKQAIAVQMEKEKESLPKEEYSKIPEKEIASNSLGDTNSNLTTPVVDDLALRNISSRESKIDPASEKSEQVVDLGSTEKNDTAFETNPPEKVSKTKKRKTVSKVSKKSVVSKSDGLYTIQVASFKNRDKAAEFLNKIQAENKGKFVYPPYIVTSSGNFQVRVGKSSDRKRVESLLSRLKLDPSLKKKASIVKTN